MSKSGSPSSSASAVAGSANSKRRDPPGMRRTSLYITAEAAEALEAATNDVVAALGDNEVPRHVALSALLLAGAEQAEVVAERLIEQRAAELTERLAALRQGRSSTK